MYVYVSPGHMSSLHNNISQLECSESYYYADMHAFLAVYSIALYGSIPCMQHTDHNTEQWLRDDM